MLRKCKTMEDKTRRDNTDETQHANPRDPRLGCIECVGSVTQEQTGLRSRNALEDFLKATMWKLTGKMPEPRSGTHTLCEPAQSICTWRSRKSHFIRKFTGKMFGPRASPERRDTLCASLRSRNGDVTRATSYRNYRKNGRAQSEPRTQTHILCEPAQSWTFHKRHFV